MRSTRQLAAIMFTDMVGFTALMQQNEQLAIQKRDRSKKIFEDCLGKHNGKLLQYYGDGTLSIFSSGVDAVRAAIEMQMLFLAEPKIEIRIGIHTGDVMIDDNGVYGDSVNVASRIESLATPGGVFISEKLFDEVKNTEDIGTKALGYFEFKNVKQPIQVYAISNPGLMIPSREELKGKTKTILDGIAVLPFTSLSSDPENEFFCDGMTEELINVLAKVEGLHVISRTSAFAFKGKNEDVREIGAKLSVQKIIEGSVRKAGNKIRITVQLINAADGYHFWSEAYDRNLEDIFEIQDDIARAIANKLRANLNTEKHESPLAKSVTGNIEAYKKYLHALHHYNSTWSENKGHALELFREVIQLDPGMVNAYAYLSISYTFMAQSGQMSAAEASELSGKYAAKAMSIDPENPLSLMALSSIKLYAWEWEEGRKLLQKAIDINPNDANARQLAAEYGLVFIQHDEVIENTRHMRRLDPLSANTLGHAARYLAFLGHADEALLLADEALDLDANNMVAKHSMVLAFTLKGVMQHALELALENYRAAGNFPFVLLALAMVYGRMGANEKKQEIIEAFEKMKEKNPNSHLDFAIALTLNYFKDFEKFYPSYDLALQEKSVIILQCYGTELMRAVWYDDHVVESRKKLGLPVMQRGNKQ